jgi:hypothetical protein
MVVEYIRYTIDEAIGPFVHDIAEMRDYELVD